MREGATPSCIYVRLNSLRSDSRPKGKLTAKMKYSHEQTSLFSLGCSQPASSRVILLPFLPFPSISFPIERKSQEKLTISHNFHIFKEELDLGIQYFVRQFCIISSVSFHFNVNYAYVYFCNFSKYFKNSSHYVTKISKNAIFKIFVSLNLKNLLLNYARTNVQAVEVRKSIGIDLWSHKSVQEHIS